MLAANQVLMQFLMIASYALDGFAFSAEALVGQAVGARAPERVRRASLLAGGWGLVAAALMAAGFALAGGLIVDTMTTNAEARAQACSYLPYLVGLPVIACAAFILDGIFVGATRSRDMRNMMVLSFAIYVVCVAVLVPLIGNHGLWLAMLISFVARGVTLGVRYPALERAAA